MASLKIGTRTSALARVQTDMVAHLLSLAHPDLHIEIVPIKASGDWRPEQGEQRLAEAAGGKGMFIKEVEQAVLNGDVDCGVHNLKDVPSFLPEGVAIDHYLKREDARDVLIGPGIQSIADIPQGAVIGTSSLRRQAMLLKMRPDLIVKPLRGNVDTRLEKLRAGQVDVAVLASVGLHRLNRSHEINAYISVDDMLPACGQGTLCIETRANDVRVRALIDAIGHTETTLVSVAERAVLADLDGSCRTPIGAYATLNGHMMTCRAELASSDGREIYKAQAMAQVLTVAQGAELGRMVAEEIRAKAGQEALDRLGADFHQKNHAATA